MGGGGWGAGGGRWGVGGWGAGGGRWWWGGGARACMHTHIHTQLHTHACNHPALPTSMPTDCVSGSVVPSLHSLLNTCKTCHRALLPDVPLVGWDVALTNDGPMLLELNISCNFFNGRRVGVGGLNAGECGGGGWGEVKGRRVGGRGC